MADYRNKLKPIATPTASYKDKLVPISQNKPQAKSPGLLSSPAIGGLASKLSSQLGQAPSASTGERGLFESIVKRPLERLVLEPGRRFGETLGSLAVGAFGTPEQKQRAEEATKQDVTYHLPFLGDFKTRGVNGGAKQIAGETAETAMYLFPYGQASKAAGSALGTVLPKGLATVAGKSAAGASAGYLADVSRKLEADAPVKEAAKPGIATVIGALLPVATESAKGLAKLAQKGGDKIQYSTIKPTQADISDGFSVETLRQHNIHGSLRNMMEQTDSQMDDLTRQLNSRLRGSTAQVNMQTVMENTRRNLQTNSLYNFGSNTRVDGALAQLQDELNAAVPAKNASLIDATTIKRAAGHYGAWQFNLPDPDATARQKVYNAFYNALKKEIERVAPEGVASINKQLSDLIPVINALIRRIPVAERNAAISLTDMVSLATATIEPRALALTAANFLSKSSAFGSVLSRTGTSASNALNSPTATALGTLGQRGAMGTLQVGLGEKR